MSNDKTPTVSVHKYQKLLETLHSSFPQAVDEANMLANSIIDPRFASADECWKVLWDKPLYANTNILTAGSAILALREYGFDDRQQLADPEGAFLIEKIGKGSVNASYNVIGQKIKDLLAEKKIARYRIYTILGGAHALKRRKGDRINAPFGDLFGKKLHIAIDELRGELGFGWGNTTIVHFLTDLGLACKTDLHLVKTMQFLGLYEGGEQPNRNQIVQINEAVVDLLCAVEDSVTPRRLRWIDKILMEVSRRGLL